MSDQTKTIPLPEPYSRQKLASLYRNLSITDDTVKLLRKYLKAMTNLYGVIPLDKVYEIINSQNPGLLTKAEFSEYIMIARHEQEYFLIIGEADLYTGRKFETSLNRLLIDLYLLDEKWQSLEKVRTMQADKPYYIPEKNILLRYHDPDYTEPTPQSKAMKCFWHEIMGFSAESANYIFLELQLIARTVDTSVNTVINYLEDNDLHNMTKAQMTVFLDLYMALHNHTRMQCNCGYTPAEIADMKLHDTEPIKSLFLGPNIRNQLKDGTLIINELQSGILIMELPNEDIRKDMLEQLEEIRKEMQTDTPASKKQPKVGRNDLCPCGSGKKYKKCCGK